MPPLAAGGAVFCAIAMWFYFGRVLVPYQVSDANEHGRPRGNLSDLYPRWIGAQELLLHGRDPYSAAVTREIQAGYYGRPLDPSRPEDPKDLQGFAYPVFVVFYLAPTLHLPFGIVQRGFLWILIGLTSASVVLWLRMLHSTESAWIRAGAIALTLGSLPVMQGLKLQQLSLLVAAMMAVALALLAADHAVPAGIVLALAAIKPQLLFPLLLWLCLWTLADWRRRYRWVAAFLVTLAIMVALSEWYLPHWIPRFWQAVREYRNYTEARSVLQNLLPPLAGRGLEMLIAAATVILCWRLRKQPSSASSFVHANCAILCVTVLLVPTPSLYNQVLLMPAVLMLSLAWRAYWQGTPAGRVICTVAGVVMLWPWLASILLVVVSFAWPARVIAKTSAAPFWAALFLPPAITLLALVYLYRQPSAQPAERATA